MATHHSILAWRIPRTEEPGGLQSMGWQRVRHDWSDWARTHTSQHLHCPLPVPATTISFRTIAMATNFASLPPLCRHPAHPPPPSGSWSPPLKNVPYVHHCRLLLRFFSRASHFTKSTTGGVTTACSSRVQGLWLIPGAVYLLQPPFSTLMLQCPKHLLPQELYTCLSFAYNALPLEAHMAYTSFKAPLKHHSTARPFQTPMWKSTRSVPRTFVPLFFFFNGKKL